MVELTGRAFMMGREVDLIRDSLYSTYTPSDINTADEFAKKTPVGARH